MTSISILAHDKFGDLLVYEGLSGPGKICDLKKKDFRGNINLEGKIFDKNYSSEFFNNWISESPWIPMFNLKIELVSGSLYKIYGHVDGAEFILQVRMGDFYCVKYARFQVSGVSSAIVSLAVKKSEDSEEFYILEGGASVGRSFSPGKKLEVKDKIFLSKINNVGANNNSVEFEGDNKINFLNEIKIIDSEIGKLLDKISALNQQKTQLIENFVGQGSLLD